MEVKFDTIEQLNKGKEKVLNKLKSKNIQYFFFINIYLYGLLGTLILLKFFKII